MNMNGRSPGTRAYTEGQRHIVTWRDLIHTKYRYTIVQWCDLCMYDSMCGCVQVRVQLSLLPLRDVPLHRSRKPYAPADGPPSSCPRRSPPR